MLLERIYDDDLSQATPERLSYLVTDGAFADQPGYHLTGDFAFSGDVGRPDLLDEAPQSTPRVLCDSR